MEKKIPYKIYLSEEEMPTKWYNVRADMPTKPAPLISPADGHALTLEEMNPIFCEELNKQELDNDTRYFDIPQEVLDFYRMYRPSPLVRAYFLEKQLRYRSGLLRQEAGSQGRYDRDRRRPVGNRPQHGLLLLQAGLQGIHGKGFL